MFQLQAGSGVAAPRWHVRCLVIAAWVLLSHSGCKTPRDVELGPPPSRFQDPNLTPFQVRRVVMLPLANLTHDNDVGHEFSMLLAAELRTKGAFELIVLDHVDVPDGSLQLAASSQFDDRLLAYIGRKYRADAVIIGRINHYHAYWPPSISMSLHCVDTRDGVVLASLDGNWDARNKYVARQARKFYAYLDPHDSLDQGELVLNAPSYFQKFVAHQITDTFFNSPRWNVESPAGTNE